MKLKLYTDKAWIPAGCDHPTLLDAFWGDNHYDPEGNMQQIARSYHERGKEIFALVDSLAECDALLLPVDWFQLASRPEALAHANDLMQRAAAAGKRVVIFYSNDHPLRYPWPPHALVFRTAVQRSWLRPNEFIVPQWSRDYLAEIGGELPVREQGEVPLVGFCGFSPPLGMRPGMRRNKEILRLIAHRLGMGALFPTKMAHAARARALQALARSPLVQTNYLIRGESAFDNPIGAFLPGGSVEAAVLRRREFVDNILGSDYVLCARGWANCSIRFYETLSLGRIPVLIDTDCVLPYEFAIDWDKYCVRVKENALGHAGRAVRDFHASMAPGEFEARQRACRELWEEWFSPLGFFKNLYRHFDPAVCAP